MLRVSLVLAVGPSPMDSLHPLSLTVMSWSVVTCLLTRFEGLRSDGVTTVQAEKPSEVNHVGDFRSDLDERDPPPTSHLEESAKRVNPTVQLKARRPSDSLRTNEPR